MVNMTENQCSDTIMHQAAASIHLTTVPMHHGQFFFGGGGVISIKYCELL